MIHKAESLVVASSWQRNQLALQKHLQTEPLKDFLTWSTIQATMYVGDAPYIPAELSSIPAEQYHILRNPGIGGLQNGDLCTNLIHQYYHLKQWLDRTRQSLGAMDSIIEIGAGYGAMCLICRRLGFEGRYYIVDLPELEQIQWYYLSQTVPDYRSTAHWIKSPKSCDLLIACHSISEMPKSEREEIMSQIEVKEYLFTSFYKFDGVDNEAWFKKFAEKNPNSNWDFYLHPYQENIFYQVGVMT